MGRVSSLLAAMITWDTAWAKESPATVPLMVGSAGSGGYSASGMVARWKLLRRQVRVTLLPSVSISTGADGRLRQMSASSRPETRMVPSTAMSAGISSLAEVS
jgi:hypothetical protein